MNVKQSHKYLHDRVTSIDEKLHSFRPTADDILSLFINELNLILTALEYFDWNDEINKCVELLENKLFFSSFCFLFENIDAIYDCIGDLVSELENEASCEIKTFFNLDKDDADFVRDVALLKKSIISLEKFNKIYR